MTDAVRIERVGPVARLVVDRPEARNALDPPTMQRLAEAIDRLAEATDVRAVVVAGGGGRFLSGGDLKALKALRTPGPAADMARTMQSALAALAALPVPVIAAIDRYAYGGGAEVALACDLRVATHDAVLCFRHGDFGVTTAWSGARRLEALVGRSRALRLLWTSAEVSAAAAKAMGLVDVVAPPGESASHAAMALAQDLAGRAPAMIAGTKRLLAPAADADRDALEAELFGATWASDDHWAAVDAFWARRRGEADGGDDAAPSSLRSPGGWTPREAQSTPPARPRPPVAARGRFIVFEGLDGAGTTTQARLLCRWLRRQGRTVLPTAEPSDGPVGRLLRQALARRVAGREGERLNPQTIAALFAADRADHVAHEIEPALARGEDVVCDRYAGSSLAYQGAECEPAWVAELNRPMPAPDLVLYVRVPVEIAAHRRAGRGGEPEIYEVDAFQRRVAAGYDAAARWRPDDPVVVIDGTPSVRAVQRACRAAVVEAFGRRPGGAPPAGSG
ncbi:MAG: dTMP kinase [Myxococcales bacterium]|nr:dTMP kinase [Myxococcales bacterium]